MISGIDGNRVLRFAVLGVVETLTGVYEHEAS